MPITGTKRRAYGYNNVGRSRRVYARAARKNWRARVRDVINDQTETKSKTTDVSATAITTTVITHELTDIDVGDGATNRDGNEIYTRSVGGKLIVEQGASNAGCQYVRMVLYTPKNVDNLATTITYKSTIDRMDYIIYFDKLVKVDQYSPCKVIKLGKKFYNNKIPGLLTQYTSTTAGDLIRKPVVLALVSNVAAVDPPTYEGRLTLFFKDK